jgi:hypothetical protein
LLMLLTQPYHPSIIIHNYLLEEVWPMFVFNYIFIFIPTCYKASGASVAVTRDDDWCALVNEVSVSLFAPEILIVDLVM